MSFYRLIVRLEEPLDEDPSDVRGAGQIFIDALRTEYPTLTDLQFRTYVTDHFDKVHTAEELTNLMGGYPDLKQFQWQVSGMATRGS